MILYNGLTLAYIGDAYYELWIRDYCLQKGDTLVRDLHKRAILYTQATAQALAANKLVEEFYSEAEISIFKRGRNHSATHKPKNADVQTYNKSLNYRFLDIDYFAARVLSIYFDTHLITNYSLT